MIKVMSMMKRKEGMSFDAFQSWLVNDHAKIAKGIPGMRKYTINILAKSNDELPFEAASEMWFDSEAAMMEAFGTDGGKAAGGDAAAHCSNRVRLVLNEHVQW
jgi:uncharacterized protein (TIGR02118 family)